MAIHIRSRDVRGNIKEHGYEQGVVMSLERVCEEMIGLRQNMQELAKLTSQCIDQVEQMIAINTGMKQRITDMEKQDEQFRTIDHVPPRD